MTCKPHYSGDADVCIHGVHTRKDARQVGVGSLLGQNPIDIGRPPIKILAAYGRHVTLEGPEAEGVVVAEFPSIEDARAWYDSPAYQEVAQHRFRGAVCRGLIVEGV
jgi:hypothetical protein